MRSPSRDSAAKGAFVLSLVLLAFLYGFAAREYGFFPSSFVVRAAEQASTLVRSHLVTPTYWHKPRIYDRSGVRRLHPDRAGDDPVLIGSNWESFDWRTGFKLVSPEGEVLHEWRIDPMEFSSNQNPAERFQEVHGSHLLDDGHIIANVDYAGTARYDACGRMLWQIPGGHHSVARAEDGTFWVPGRRETLGEGPTRTGDFPGLERPVYHDLLLNVSPDGTVLQSIGVLEVLYENGLERLLPKAEESEPGDLTHLNDVEPLSTAMAGSYEDFAPGDLLVSLRNLHLVLVLDPGSGRVKWHADENFVRQHDPDFMGGGWIGVFDNRWDGTRRGSMLGGSRIVALRPATDSMTVVYPASEEVRFYTPEMGKWQQLPGGNLLLTESQTGRIIEVDADGRALWEWIARPYDGASVPEVSEGTRYELSRREIASWPCPPSG